MDAPNAWSPVDWRRRLGGARVAVLGDVMLDHYVEGGVSRISDEAPVPILKVASERYAPGGAANVAANAAALGAGAVKLVGLVGADLQARLLEERLAAVDGALSVRLIADARRSTVVKTRYLGRLQQIVRVDREIGGPVEGEAQAALLDAAREAIRASDVLILSDYGKGALSDAVLAAALEEAKAAGVAVIVDPKRADYSAYGGASVITPNRKELTEATGLPCESDEDAVRAGLLAARASGAAILLTRSEKGMALIREDGPPVFLAARAIEVFDVSGAGDTVVAALSAALGAGAGIEAAMTLANAAAGVAVSRRGTAIVGLEEALDALEARAPRALAAAPAPILPRAALLALRDEWRRAGLSVGFANGCFDLLHAGHVSLIAEAAGACDRLVVALNDDASVRRLKGPDRPVQDEVGRAAVMAALKGVSAVTLFEEDTPLELIRALEPDVLIKGADYAGKEVVGADLVTARGGRVLLAGLIEGRSTSAILARAKDER